MTTVEMDLEDAIILDDIKMFNTGQQDDHNNMLGNWQKPSYTVNVTVSAKNLHMHVSIFYIVSCK